MTVRIITDSTCDLPREVIEKLGIYVLPIYIHVGNQSFLDGIDITREDFYRSLPDYAYHPTTAVPSPAKFKALYDAMAEEGADEILSIHVSSNLSGLVEIARATARETTSAKVYVVDSRQLSLGTGFLAATAAELAQEGRTAREIIPLLERQIMQTRVTAVLDTLKYLRRSGRVNGLISSVGGLLQIKPVMSVFNGIVTLERVRTQQKALERLLSHLKSCQPVKRMGLLYTGTIETAQVLFNHIRAMLPEHEIWQEQVNPVVGTHIGPGAAGFACVTSHS